MNPQDLDATHFHQTWYFRNADELNTAVARTLGTDADTVQPAILRLVCEAVLLPSNDLDLRAYALAFHDIACRVARETMIRERAERMAKRRAQINEARRARLQALQSASFAARLQALKSASLAARLRDPAAIAAYNVRRRAARASAPRLARI